MYDIIKQLIGHEWISNYTGDQQYVYCIAGTVIVILLVTFIDLLYRIFHAVIHRK